MFYQALQYFITPNRPEFIKDQSYSLPKELGEEFVKRGLMAVERAKMPPKNDDKEERVKDTQKKNKSFKKAKEDNN